jgi:hypothetical protein
MPLPSAPGGGLVRRALRAWTLTLLCAATTSCQHWSGARGDCSGAVAVAGSARRLHLRVLLEHDGAQRRHEVVVQVEPARIQVVGLTPMGTQAFTLTDDAQRFTIDDRVGRHLGMNPRLLYDAIAHAFLAPPGAERDPAVRVARESGPPTSVRVNNPACEYEAWLVVLSDDAASLRASR